jgi:tRNA pseudouridine38-40 synthase
MQKSRYFLKLAYNGTNFHGWQVQNNAVTVQGEIQRALSILLRNDIAIMGCGRTDTGVHASCFYAHFEVEELPFTEEKLVYKLNALLGKDIAIYSIFKVKEDLHTRFSATEREYKYYISLKKNPFNSNAWLYVGNPDIELMNEAASHLLSVSDFGAFCKAHAGNATNICQVSCAQWEVQNDYLIFTIRADRFLRNMVRSVVGTLLLIGEQKINFTDFKNIIQSGKRSLAGESVPAKGLFLTDVKYPFNNE